MKVRDKIFGGIGAQYSGMPVNAWGIRRCRRGTGAYLRGLLQRYGQEIEQVMAVTVLGLILGVGIWELLVQLAAFGLH